MASILPVTNRGHGCEAVLTTKMRHMQDSNSGTTLRKLSPALATQLGALSPVSERAVIINCSTKTVSTLALLAALRYAGMPVLLVDCESNDGSEEWFRDLAARYDFDLIYAPLKPHGRTLDEIFMASRDESLLLIDSDLEILRDDLMPLLRAAMSDSQHYGAGFLHVDHSLTLGPAEATARGRYADRMWIPFCFLKVARVRAAIAEGSTFMHSRDYIEFPWSTTLSKWIYARHRIPLARRISLEGFADARQRIHGERAAFREYDTGGRIHDALTANGQLFAHLGEPYWSQSVRHYHGVTRATLTADQANATAPTGIEVEVSRRLAEVYGVVVA
jgi:glycosyltransferase involved in cell wall biosynthesis